MIEREFLVSIGAQKQGPFSSLTSASAVHQRTQIATVTNALLHEFPGDWYSIFHVCLMGWRSCSFCAAQVIALTEVVARSKESGKHGDAERERGAQEESESKVTNQPNL